MHCFATDLTRKGKQCVIIQKSWLHTLGLTFAYVVELLWVNILLLTDLGLDEKSLQLPIELPWDSLMCIGYVDGLDSCKVVSAKKCVNINF